MRLEILSEEQTKLLPLVQKFYKDFGLVGGTAIVFVIKRAIAIMLFLRYNIHRY